MEYQLSSRTLIENNQPPVRLVDYFFYVPLTGASYIMRISKYIATIFPHFFIVNSLTQHV